MKKVILHLIVLFSITDSVAQSCVVSVQELVGQYTGGCKKGKAEGQGTATGIDKYIGAFRNGQPHGRGKYEWKDGGSYDGLWKDGLFDGSGTLKKPHEIKRDSMIVMQGFWKKGKYVGQYEKPYLVNTLTNNISDVSVRKLNNTQSQIVVTVKSVTGGAASNSGVALPKARLTNIEIIEGRFEQQLADETSSPISNKYSFRQVTFPFYAVLTFAATGTFLQPEKFRIEVRESGDWYVQVAIEN
jgi:hypothetical protein